MPLSNNSGPLTKAFATKAKAKSLLANIWTHDVVERLRLRRVGEAKERGLEDYDVGIYPSELLIKKGIGLKGVLVGAAILSSGIAGGVALSDHFNAEEIITTEIIEREKVFDTDIEMEIIPP